jgi:hypothetical protein
VNVIKGRSLRKSLGRIEMRKGKGMEGAVENYKAEDARIRYEMKIKALRSVPRSVCMNVLHCADAT